MRCAIFTLQLKFIWFLVWIFFEKIVNIIKYNTIWSGSEHNVIAAGRLTYNLCQRNHNNCRKYGPHSFYDYNNVIRCTQPASEKIKFPFFSLQFDSQHSIAIAAAMASFRFRVFSIRCGLVVVNFYFHFFQRTITVPSNVPKCLTAHSSQPYA